MKCRKSFQYAFNSTLEISLVLQIRCYSEWNVILRDRKSKALCLNTFLNLRKLPYLSFVLKKNLEHSQYTVLNRYCYGTNSSRFFFRIAMMENQISQYLHNKLHWNESYWRSNVRLLGIVIKNTFFVTMLSIKSEWTGYGLR